MGLELFDGRDLDAWVKGLAESAVIMLDARPAPAGEMTVVVCNGWGGVLFHEACGHQMEADFITKGTSAYAGRIGERVANERITALDDGTLPGRRGSLRFDDEGTPAQRTVLIGKMGTEVGADTVTLLDSGRMKRGFASAPFDGEGVPTGATRLIDEGMLQGVMYDSYSAARDASHSTGNAQRGSYRELPTLGPSNFYLQPGTQSRDEIIAGVERGLYVTRIMQTGGINPINGDCSMAASGMWIENGQFVHPVNGVTIGTTLQDLLKQVAAVGSDLKTMPFFGAISAPTVRVDNMTIGGINTD